MLGTYCGIVENVSDPLKLGRVEVRVPRVYGISAEGGGFIGVNDLPWAMPAGMPAGSGKASGGFSHLPEPGDHVYVRFLDGEPEKPVWEWGMQTVPDAKSLKLHQYEMVGNKVGKPSRAGWTRYGHTFELNLDGVIATSSQGYRVSLTDGDEDATNGVVQIATPLGNMFEMDDESGDLTVYGIEDLYLNIADTITAQARAVDLTCIDSATMRIGTSLDIVADAAITVESLTAIELKFEELKLGLGTEPFVLGNQLVTFLESLLLWLTTHTHGNGNLGSPTTPPIVPPEGTVTPEPAQLVSETIMGE